MPASGDRPGVPTPLLIAALVVLVEGLLLIGLAVWELSAVTAERRSLGLSTAGFFGAYGVLLIFAARAVWRRQSWARGPILITQLILLGLAWTVRSEFSVAIALALSAAIVIGGLVHPDSVAALEREADRSR